MTYALNYNIFKRLQYLKLDSFRSTREAINDDRCNINSFRKHYVYRAIKRSLFYILQRSIIVAQIVYRIDRVQHTSVAAAAAVVVVPLRTPNLT